MPIIAYLASHDYPQDAKVHRGLVALLAYAQQNPFAHQWIAPLTKLLQRGGAHA